MNTEQAKEILKKVRQVEIRTNRLVNDSLAGQYHSVFKGRGMDFDEVREYVPGDEVRAIDWNVTARAGRAFVKKFTEERELTILLVVDLSASGNFGSGPRSKRQMAAELASVLAFSATRNSDKVGLVLFTDQIEQYIPPKKGRQHVLRSFARSCSSNRTRAGQTSSGRSISRPGNESPRDLFLLSDFELPDQEQSLTDLRRGLRLASRRHDLVALHVHDLRESELPDVGQLSVEDAESGELIELDTTDENVRSRFAELAKQRMDNLRRALAGEGVDALNLDTSEPYEPALRSFFKNRERRMR